MTWHGLNFIFPINNILLNRPKYHIKVYFSILPCNASKNFERLCLISCPCSRLFQYFPVFWSIDFYYLRFSDDFKRSEKGCTGKKWVNEDHHYLHQANLISNVIQLMEAYCSAWYLCLNLATSSLKSSFSSLLNLFLSDLLNSLSIINMLT